MIGSPWGCNASRLTGEPNIVPRIRIDKRPDFRPVNLTFHIALTSLRVKFLRRSRKNSRDERERRLMSQRLGNSAGPGVITPFFGVYLRAPRRPFP
jgi:hypothetical protein